MSKHGTAIYTLGQYNEVHVALTRALPRALEGTDPKQVIKAVQKGEALEQGLDKMIQLLLGEKSSIEFYSVTVNYGVKIETAVKRGHYDYANKNITSQNFPTKKKGKVERRIGLIPFGSLTSGREALMQLDQMGYIPADLRGLLTFGENYPEVQREFPIVAFGSMWQGPDGGLCVPYLWGNAGYRRLSLDRLENAWNADCRFAAYHK